MDHDDAGRVYLDRITGAHDNAAARHGDPIHNASELCAAPGKLSQAVMNHVRCSGVTAVAIHADGNVFAGRNLLEILQKLTKQNVLPFDGFAPPICRLLLVDIPVHGDLRRIPGGICSRHGINGLFDADLRSLVCALWSAHFLFSFQTELDGIYGAYSHSRKPARQSLLQRRSRSRGQYAHVSVK